jgi:hypothetical protein
LYNEENDKALASYKNGSEGNVAWFDYFFTYYCLEFIASIFFFLVVDNGSYLYAIFEGNSFWADCCSCVLSFFLIYAGSMEVGKYVKL